MNGLETVIVCQASCAAALPDPARGAAHIHSDSDERMMVNSGFVFTGAPGVGKTTLVNSILRILAAKNASLS